MRFGKVNTDEQPGLSERFEVRGIPTFIVFVEGKEASRKVGFAGLADLHDFIDYYKS
jgi:thioredoxin-like negative regulator of GroEL